MILKIDVKKPNYTFKMRLIKNYPKLCKNQLFCNEYNKISTIL